MNRELNIHEAKTHLSRYLSELAEGERILLCRRNRPIAEIRLLPESADGPRPIGLGKGSVQVPDTFFEPLPEEMLGLFGGGS
jgi:antitoxin (DNA-binding transcriptional repressor) of toxin-antitoxin stability system